MEPIMLMKPYGMEEKDAEKYLYVDGWWADKKLDGFACQVLIDEDIRVFSGTGKLKDWTAKLPWLVEEFSSLVDFGVLKKGDILVGELISGSGNSTDDRRSISVINGKPETVIAHQEKYGDIIFAIYDIVNEGNYYMPLEERNKRLEVMGDGEYYIIVRKAKTIEEKLSLYARSKREGWEGLVLKHKGSPYLWSKDKNLRDRNYWIKLKYEKTADVIVMGVKQEFDIYGNPKEMAGAIVYGAIKDGEVVMVGTAGGIDRDEKIRMWQKFKNGKEGKGGVRLINLCEVDDMPVAEIKYQRMNKNAPAHPRFVRWRTDKLASDCLWEHL